MGRELRISSLIWNIIVTIATSFYAVFIPLSLVHNFHEYDLFIYIKNSAYVILILDIFFNLYYYKYRESEFIFDEQTGLSLYFKSWFIIDLLAVIPLGLIFPHSLIQLIRLVKLLKIAYFMRLLKRREVRFTNMLTLLFFFYWVAHFAHWLACGWLSLRGMDTSLTFIDNYVKSLYWTVTTITTVGYGDITPINTAQTLYALFVEIIGVGSYGYLIGKIASFLSKKDPAKNRYFTNLENLTTLVKLRNVPKGLQRKLHDYYTYMYKQKLGFDESKFLDGLPESLKLELSISLKKEAIEKIPLFHGQNDIFLEEIALHLKPAIYTPGDYIFREGDEGFEVYFIIRGELEVLSGKEEKLISVLREGDFFGEIALFHEVPRTASVKAVSYCDLYTLAKKRFDFVLSKYPDIQRQIKEKAELRQFK